MTESHHPFIFIHIKGFHTYEESVDIVRSIINYEDPEEYPKWIAAPLTFISRLQNEFPDSKITIGAEKMLSTVPNTFTASIAAKFLKSEGAKFVLIGSISERLINPDDSQSYSTKISEALLQEITPILCITESSLQESDEENSIKENLKKQIAEATSGLSQDQIASLYIFYDAPWINTTPWEANHPVLTQAYATFEAALKEAISPEIHEKLKIIYSVPTHSHELEAIVASHINATGFSFGIASHKPSSQEKTCET